MITFNELSRETVSMTKFSNKSFTIELKAQTKQDNVTEILGTTKDGEERQLYTFLIPRRKVNGMSIGRSQFVSFWADRGLAGNTYKVNPELCEIDTVKVQRTDDETGETTEHVNSEVVFLNEDSFVITTVKAEKQVAKQPSLAESIE